MQPTIRYTTHALSRSTRRNLSANDVEFVLTHGRQVRAAGALHVFLAGRDIPPDKATTQRYGHLEGTTLVLDEDDDDLVLIRRTATGVVSKPCAPRRVMTGGRGGWSSAPPTN